MAVNLSQNAQLHRAGTSSDSPKRRFGNEYSERTVVSLWDQHALEAGHICFLSSGPEADTLMTTIVAPGVGELS